MNVTVTLATPTMKPVVFRKRPMPVVNDREFDLMPVENVLVRLGPYDNSDAIEIKRNEDTNEIMVIHHNSVDLPEIVLSVMEETP